MSKYPVYDITEWPVTEMEPEGDDPKFWIRGAVGEPSESSWLYKQATTKEIAVRQAEGGGTRFYRRGEAWTEKVCAELASLIGMPAARTELAVRDGFDGSLSRNVRPDGWSLNGGGVLLGQIDERYQPKSEADRRRNRIGHTVDNVRIALENVAPPPGWVHAGATAFDCFAGYLMFDAWIANRDRHEFNWAVLQDPRGELHLSPSFDHGAALGSGLEDPARERLSLADGAARWCASGTAHRFEDRGDVSLLAVAREALDTASPAARALWMKVAELTPSDWQSVLHRVPSLSVPAATFTNQVLTINQERIRDECQRS